MQGHVVADAQLILPLDDASKRALEPEQHASGQHPPVFGQHVNPTSTVSISLTLIGKHVVEVFRLCAGLQCSAREALRTECAADIAVTSVGT